MKISIALATYNGEKYLQEQLDSFLEQTRLPDELVVSDDVSTDSTVAILKEFKGKVPFKVKVIENEENEGYTKNFEKAIQETTGDLIFLSDQDDIWFERKIEEMVATFQKEESLLTLCNRKHVDYDLTYLGEDSLSRCKRLGIDLKKYAPGCAMMISKAFKEILLPIPNAKYIAYDNWINNLALFLRNRTLLKQEMQIYRISKESTSDFILGRKDKSNRLKFLLAEEKDNRVENYLNRSKAYKLYKKRISEKRNPINRLNSFNSDELIEEIESLIIRYSTRYRIRKKKIYKRLPKIISSIISGIYSYKGGFKSVLKDIIIP